MVEGQSDREMEPMWPSLVALLAAGGLYAALPESLALGPRWLLVALVLFSLAPSEILHSRGHHKFCRPIGFFVISAVTIGMIVSVVLLVRAIPAHVVEPEQLLQSATALWVSNILVFAVWYWRLDAGGPHQRSLREHHTHNHGAFLFPQMTLRPEQEKWSPLFVDYLFLAFNTSTALSPTDVPVLSRWAKVLMMLQSAISLAVVALLAARAVNIL